MCNVWLDWSYGIQKKRISSKKGKKRKKKDRWKGGFKTVSCELLILFFYWFIFKTYIYKWNGFIITTICTPSASPTASLLSHSALKVFHLNICFSSHYFSFLKLNSRWNDRYIYNSKWNYGENVFDAVCSSTLLSNMKYALCDVLAKFRWMMHFLFFLREQMDENWLHSNIDRALHLLSCFRNK